MENTPAPVQRTSRGLLLFFLVIVVALIAYTYGTGQLQQFASKANATMTSLVPGSSKPPNTAKSASGKDNLTAAREAFAADDMKTAIEAYRALIASNPKDMEAHGELGNVYYANGQMAEAAQTYFETANLALENKQPDVAEMLLPVIGAGNQQLAEQLNQKLLETFDAQMRTDMSRPFEGGYQQQNQQEAQQSQQHS